MVRRHRFELLVEPSAETSAESLLGASLCERRPAAVTDDESPIIAVHTRKPIGVVPEFSWVYFVYNI